MMLTTPKFFKAQNNAGGAAEFKKCLPVNVNTSFATLAPAIATAEQHWLKPIVGAPLMEEAADYYAAYGTEGDSSAMNGLIELLQMAVVRLAYWDSFDQLAVMMSDSGLSDKNGDNRAYRYQADALRASLWRQGYAYLNQAIGYCEENIDELWRFEESDYYTVRQQSAIRSMKEFDEIVNIEQDFVLFLRLRTYIAQAEQMELAFRIGEDLCKAFVSGRDNTRFDAVRFALMAFVAHWAMAEAVPFLNLLDAPQGIVVRTERSSSGGKVEEPIKEATLTALSNRHRQMAERYIGQAVTYMKANASLFPEIEVLGGSDHEKTAAMRDNRGKKTFLTL